MGSAQHRTETVLVVQTEIRKQARTVMESTLVSRKKLERWERKILQEGWGRQTNEELENSYRAPIIQEGETDGWDMYVQRVGKKMKEG